MKFSDMRQNNKLMTAAACLAVSFTAAAATSTPIDRHALVVRNNPHVTAVDTMASLTVGNGEFAFTADVTGLQSFPSAYSKGVPLGTQSAWGWHSFPDTQNLKPEEAFKYYDFGRGRQEPYSVQIKGTGRGHDASEYFRINPHRLHLGAIGFDGVTPGNVTNIDQTLDLWNGAIKSSYKLNGKPVSVTTTCHPQLDMVAATISNKARTPLAIRFPYPSGAHCDDACDWTKDDLHTTDIVSSAPGHAVIRHTLDTTVYYVNLTWDGKAELSKNGKNTVRLTPKTDNWSFTAQFLPDAPGKNSTSQQLPPRKRRQTIGRNSGKRVASLISDSAPTRAPRNSNAA